MNTAPKSPKPDRATVEAFAKFYSEQLGCPVEFVSYPEHNMATPADARIEAIYKVGGSEMHVEHTSVDLIMIGEMKKRDLNPGFLFLEKQIEQVVVPAGRGVRVYLPLNVEGVNALKSSAPALIKGIEEYIAKTDPQEWHNPRTKRKAIDCPGGTFFVRAEGRSDRIMLGWLNEDHNFPEAESFEKILANLLPSKLSKLQNSTRNSTGRTFSVLLIETDDVAAVPFCQRCGEFARVLASHDTNLSELWGITDKGKPFLIWCDNLDKGRVDSPYDRDWARIIDSERLSNWKQFRSSSLSD